MGTGEENSKVVLGQVVPSIGISAPRVSLDDRLARESERIRCGRHYLFLPLYIVLVFYRLSLIVSLLQEASPRLQLASGGDGLYRRRPRHRCITMALSIIFAPLPTTSAAPSQ